jgi:hypothetical protein
MDVSIGRRAETLTLLLRVVEAGDQFPGVVGPSRRRRHQQAASLNEQVRLMLTDGAYVTRASDDVLAIALPGWTRRRAESLLRRLRAWVTLDGRVDLQGAVVGGLPSLAGAPRSPTVSAGSSPDGAQLAAGWGPTTLVSAPSTS